METRHSHLQAREKPTKRAQTEKANRAAKDLSVLNEGDTVSRDDLDVAYDSQGESHPVNKNPPTLTPELLKRALAAQQTLQAARAAGAEEPSDVDERLSFLRFT